MKRIALLPLILCALVMSPLRAAEPPKEADFTASDGTRIHYYETGQGPAVILIHGYTGTGNGNWFSNGIADALAKNHHVVALDCRGHGKSDKPHDPEKYGPHMAQDVIDLMDHLKIKKAHVHGYSMGGYITTQLLAHHADRFISATYGGSGIPETDPEMKLKVPADKPGPDPLEAEASAKLRSLPQDAEALAAVRQNAAWSAPESREINLPGLTLPVMAIIGEYDRPQALTHRMAREIKDFRRVILPGKSHLTAIMQGYIPPLYVDSLVVFINEHDPK